MYYTIAKVICMFFIYIAIGFTYTFVSSYHHNKCQQNIFVFVMFGDSMHCVTVERIKHVIEILFMKNYFHVFTFITTYWYYLYSSFIYMKSRRENPVGDEAHGLFK